MNNAFKNIFKTKYVIKTKYALNHDDVVMHLIFALMKIFSTIQYEQSEIPR